MFALLLLVVCIQGQGAGIQDLFGRQIQPVVASSISSTPTGGVWSSPATWAGGVVPTAADDVTISAGATVIIDTAAAAKSVTVGETGSISGVKTIFAEGTLPAGLRFGETGAFSLTVGADVTIGSNDSLTTGGGNANQHVLTIGGNLTNNGTFDLSTNDNQAAAMLVFTGNSDNTFGGTGAVSDIALITIEKGASNTLELSPANFSVRGFTTDKPNNGFLFLNHGTFKISGTFEGAHQTFFSAPYEIAEETGLWLNNPNYTITARRQENVDIYGSLRVTAGTYNVGTEINDSLRFKAGSRIVVEGGNINVAGRYMDDGYLTSNINPIGYIQTGGIITACTAGNPTGNFGCVRFGEIRGELISITGGTFVIQNTRGGGEDFYYAVYDSPVKLEESGATVQFGNEFTISSAEFSARLRLPSVIVFEGQTLQIGFYTHNMDVRPGATLRLFGNLFVYGKTFINDGTVKVENHGQLTFYRSGNQTYSGSGLLIGPLEYLTIDCESLTLNSVNNLRTRIIFFYGRGRMINSGNLTIGNDDSIPSDVYLGSEAPVSPAQGFDSSPVFELGTGGVNVTYYNSPATLPRRTGPEINPLRRIRNLTSSAPSGTVGLIIEGGDLTVEGNLSLGNSIIDTGNNTIIPTGNITRQTGYVIGTMKRRVDVAGAHTFPVGLNGYSPVTANIASFGPQTPYLTVTIVDAPLPGLLPATSVSRHWKIGQLGDLSGRLTFTYLDTDIRGIETEYKLWYSGASSPVIVAGSHDPAANSFLSPVTTFLGGVWGIGAQLDPGPVSISGNVTTSGGQPIRNAALTISGGNLPSPVTVQTGNFGTYSFGNLQAGEAYTVRVDVKRYRFQQTTQIVTPMGNVSNVNFVANPQE
jgi:hypothetical protein